MKRVSIFNEVMGPIMRGPSSSHTAASFHLGKLVRDLLDCDPDKVIISFSKNGSYAEVYRQQGSDLGFATGIIGRKLTSNDFLDSLNIANELGINIQFKLIDFKKKLTKNPQNKNILANLNIPYALNFHEKLAGFFTSIRTKIS